MKILFRIVRRKRVRRSAEKNRNFRFAFSFRFRFYRRKIICAAQKSRPRRKSEISAL